MFNISPLEQNLSKTIISFFNDIVLKINTLITPYLHLHLYEYIKIINLNDVNNLVDNIMDFYSICIIINSTSKLNIIYYGLAHSLLYMSLLFHIYDDFEIIYNNGIHFILKDKQIYYNNVLIDDILSKELFSLFDNNTCCITY